MLLYQKPTRTIRVSQEDIDGGKRMSSQGCMVARALERQTGIQYVVVASGACPVTDYGEPQGWVSENIIMFPEEVRARISAWDDGRSVEPFSFEIPALAFAS